MNENFKENLTQALGEQGDSPEEVVEESPAEQLEKIRIGEEDFTPEEAQRLVSLGKIGREAEEKYHTDLTKVWPEYGKAKNDLKRIQEELESTKTARPQDPVDEDQAIRDAKEAARKIGLVTDDAFGEMLGKTFRDFYQREREAERLFDEVTELEREIKGDDGRPAFRAETVLEHMERTGIRNPDKAYKDLYESELDSWKEQQLARAKKPGMTTTLPGGAIKTPSEVKPTRDNLHSLISEALEHGN